MSNIVGVENKKRGWGNVSHITGTAPWMVIAAERYLLGIRTELDGLCIDPCIPKEWDNVTISRKYQGKTLNITVENPNGVTKGVNKLNVDGQIINGNFIPKTLIRDCKNDTVEITAYI